MADVRKPTPLAPPTMGLLAAATVGDGTGVRWGRGVTWLPEMHPSTSEAYGTRVLQCTPGSVLVHGGDDRPAVEVAFPFLVYAFDECGMFDERDRMGRARRLLEATQSKSIAAEFWTGTQLQAEPDVDGLDPADGTWLAKSGGANLGSKSDDVILSVLDDYIADSLANGNGMIHMTVDNMSRLASKLKIRREGRLWLTPADNIVVADAGYTGDSSLGAGSWAVATSRVEVYLGPIQTTDYPSIQAIDINTNDVVVFAQRDAIVMHEPHLVFGAATFT